MIPQTACTLYGVARYRDVRLTPADHPDKPYVSFHRLQPSKRLAPFVDFFVSGRAKAANEGPSERLLHKAPPDPSAEIFFVFKGEASIRPLEGDERRIAGARVTGMTTSATASRLAAGSEGFSIGLKPYAVRILLGVDAKHLVDRSVPLSEFIGPEAGRILEAMAAAKSTEEQVAVAEGFLEKRLNNAAMPKLVRGAVSMIRSTSGTLKVSELESRIGVSSRRLEQLFRSHVGVSPKRLSRISRIRRAVEMSHVMGKRDWGTIVYNLGFSDQAHLIREFGVFLGSSPSSLLS